MKSQPTPPRYDDVMRSEIMHGFATAPQQEGPAPHGQATVYGPATIVHGPPTAVPIPAPAVHVSATAPRLPETPRWIVALHFSNSATQFFLGAVVFSAFFMANRYTFYPNSFSQHVYLCVTGYGILLGQGIVSLDPHGGWASRLNTADKRLVHGGLQMLGSTLAIIGCIIRLSDIRSYNRPITAHGVFGWIAMVLTFLCLIGGILNFKKAEKSNSGLFKKCHKYLGVLTIFVAFIALSLGFGLFNRYFYDASATLGIIFTVLALVGLLISTFAKDLLKR